MDDWCTKKGLIPLTLADGSVYYQPCYYCKNVAETIISPQAILASSDVLVNWTQTGHKDGSPGMIRFDSDIGLFSIAMCLEYRDGLYYCPTLTSLRWTETPSDAMLQSFVAPLTPADAVTSANFPLPRLRKRRLPPMPQMCGRGCFRGRNMDLRIR